MATPTLKELKDFCRLAELKKSGNKPEIIDRVDKYLSKYKFAPRYLRGLSKADKFNKKFEIKYSQLSEKKKKTPNRSRSKLYSPSRTDLLYKSQNRQKISKYTEKWNSKYPQALSLGAKSKISGVPLPILKKVYNKGLAAWRGGAHRPGASQQSWGVSRVNSFLLCGKTWQFPDHLLAREALGRSPKSRKFWSSCNKKLLGKRTPSR